MSVSGHAACRSCIARRLHIPYSISVSGEPPFTSSALLPSYRPTPMKWNIAAFNDEVLFILDSRLHDLPYDRPQIPGQSFIILWRQCRIAAADQTHFQVIDRQIRIFIFFEHLISQKCFSSVRCARNKYDHSLAFSSFLTFARSLQVRSGIRLSISSMLLSHHLNRSIRSISSSSNRFRRTFAGFPTTMV